MLGSSILPNGSDSKNKFVGSCAPHNYHIGHYYFAPSVVVGARGAPTNLIFNILLMSPSPNQNEPNISEAEQDFAYEQELDQEKRKSQKRISPQEIKEQAKQAQEKREEMAEEKAQAVAAQKPKSALDFLNKNQPTAGEPQANELQSEDEESQTGSRLDQIKRIARYQAKEKAKQAIKKVAKKAAKAAAKAIGRLIIQGLVIAAPYILLALGIIAVIVLIFMVIAYFKENPCFALKIAGEIGGNLILKGLGTVCIGN